MALHATRTTRQRKTWPCDIVLHSESSWKDKSSQQIGVSLIMHIVRPLHGKRLFSLASCIHRRQQFNDVPTRKAISPCRSQQLGARLWQARNSGHRIEVASAGYRHELTSQFNQRQLRKYYRRAGWKVGSTSSARKSFRYHGPGSSPLLEPFCHATTQPFRCYLHMSQSSKASLCFVTGPIYPRGPNVQPGRVLSAVDAVAPGLEVVGSRRHGSLFGQDPDGERRLRHQHGLHTWRVAA